MTRLVTSRYSFRIPTAAGDVVYNAATGAVVRLDGPDAAELAIALTGRPACVPDDCLPPDLAASLAAAGVLIPDTVDEVDDIRRKYWAARDGAPVVVTITTTQDCNLGCYYCYEERTGDRLTAADVPAVVALAERRLVASGKRSLHVDWYGGEPLLNVSFLEAASVALQDMCARLGVRYAASIISNGTCWPADVGPFLSRHRIGQVQISFDGMRENHDRRRRYRKGYAPPRGASSFDLAVALVDEILDHARLDLRLNIDRGNEADLLPLIRFARGRGWFGRRFPVTVQPARLSAYTEKSAFLRPRELTADEYDAVRALVRAEVGGEAAVEESEASGGLPLPKASVCAALARDSVVVGPTAASSAAASRSERSTVRWAT